MNFRIGIVVPTLDTRPDFLIQNLRSIRNAGEAYIVIVAPAGFNYEKYSKLGLCDQFVLDPKLGLAEAINAGFSVMPADIEYLNWLGDDDLLSKDSLLLSSRALSQSADAVCVYGQCQYIDENGSLLWTNKSGSFAAKILRFGPNLIPQPGALFKRKAFEEIGGLSRNFGWAFDFDMFLKFTKVGRVVFLPEVLSSFRWHADSLTVATRKKSVADASAVRVSHLPKVLRSASFLWERPLALLTYYAGGIPARKQTKAHTS